MQIRFRQIFNYKHDGKVFFAAALLFVLAVAVYIQFFDILIPNVGNDDSYRNAVGSLFIVPIFILAAGQTLISSIFLHWMSKVVNPEKADYLRSFMIGSMMTFIFSLTYLMFPKYGPFYFIVFVYEQAPWYALPLEIGWFIAFLGLTTYAIHRFLQIPYRISAFTTFLLAIFIIVCAS